MKKQILSCLVLSVLTLSTTFGQTSQGYSSQTQPAITSQSAYIRETLRDSLIRGLFPVNPNNLVPLTTITPHIVVQSSNDNTKEVEIPVGQVDIAASSRILAAYDEVETEWESNHDLAWWLPQAIVDGDFAKLSSSSDQASPKAGTIGVDAIRMKALYRKYTYTGTDEVTGAALPQLVGRRNVFVPRFTFTMLFTLFGQGTPLNTGLKAAAIPGARATKEVARTFGQTLLAPGGLAQNGHSGLLSISWIPFMGSVFNQFSLDGTILYTHTDWSSRDSAAVPINILAPSIGISYRVFDRYLNTSANQPQVRLFARYALRHLYGDIENHSSLLVDALRSEQRTYHGFELGATATISAVRVTVSSGIFNGDLEGFSHGQMMYGLGLAAGIRL